MITIFDQRQLLHAPVRELHNGGWTAYAETPDRAETILAAIGPALPARDMGVAPIAAVHDAGYLRFLEAAHRDWLAAGRDGDAIGYAWPVVGRRDVDLTRIDARLGRYSYDASTPIAEHSWMSAYWSAQTALTALDEVARGSDGVGFALCRPCGHHAGADYLGGYCFLNNAAIAAAEARGRGLGPVAILDIDYHHGNGTQDIFAADPDMLFVSIHADPATDYPFYWGHADEHGSGAGAGTTLNLPLPRGTDWAAYEPALDQALAAVKAFDTRFLIVSFGADTFVDDPISHFRLQRSDFVRLGQRVAALALPSVIVMEGGYATADLGDNVAAFLDGFEGGRRA
ncbi:MAG TPA: histone deacetylase family protein [Sphingomonas sp.]